MLNDLQTQGMKKSSPCKTRVVQEPIDLPKEIQKTYSASLMEGDNIQKIEVEVQLRVKKRLFTENVVEGDIIIKGDTYHVSNSLDYNFIDN